MFDSPPREAPLRRQLPIIRDQSLVEAVASALRKAILAGELSPNDRLVESEIATQLGVSRGPVREAMTLLEKRGLVVSVPRHGRLVQSFSHQTLAELYSLRKLLETSAAALAVGHLTTSGKSRLRAAVALIRDAADSGDTVAVASADLAFHSLIYELSGHELLAESWHTMLHGRLELLANITTRSYSAPEEPVLWHKRIARALINLDGERASALIQEHIEDAWARASAAFPGGDARPPTLISMTVPTSVSAGGGQARLGRHP